MFGYVRVANDELRIKDLKRYRAYYCGVCRSMGKITKLGRCLLAYDLAFYALLLDWKAESDFEIKRCGINMRKKPYAVSDVVDYAANINVILAIGKLRDNVYDGQGYKGWLLALLGGAENNANKNAEKAATICETYLNKLISLEKEKCNSVDICADVFAEMCAELCAEAPFITEPNIKRILYCTGKAIARWVYTVDALDDYFIDVKSSNFNPILMEVTSGILAIRDIDNIIGGSLCNSIDEAEKCARLLPNSDNKPIIMNIITYGLREVTENVLSKFRKIYDGKINERSV